MKKFHLLLFCLPILVMAGCSSNNTPSEGMALPPNEAFVPDSLVVSVHDLRRAMIEEVDNLIVIGVVNPTRALVPFSIPSRSIKGAYLVWRPDYSGKGSTDAISTNVGGMRKSVQDMETLLSRAGATQNSKIVVYAANDMHDSARFVWQLRLLGHENAWYLDGGINAWLDAGYPTGSSSRLAKQSVVSNYKAPNYAPSEFNIDMYEMLYALENPNEWIIIDTRSRGEFDGERTGSSSGAFGTGRLANSVFINWNAAVDPETRLLRPKSELEKIYADVLDGRKIAVFCQSGVRSAHTWLVLTEIFGIDNVYNYEGSWIELSYAASQFSDFDGTRVLSHLEFWTDNNGEI